jgi:hypothetical protein
MKRLSLALIMAALIAVASCTPRTQTLVVFHIPWPDEEQVGYVIQQEGIELGSLQLTVQREDDTYILGGHYVIGGQPVGGTIKVNARDLKPISGATTYSTTEGTIDLTTVYGEGKVTITVSSGGVEILTDEIDVPPDGYDNDELFFLLRSILAMPGYSCTYTHVSPAYEQTLKATVTVGEAEEVETPAGTFNCRKLVLSAEGTEQYFWYGMEAPHYLVKWDNNAGGLILLSELP